MDGMCLDELVGCIAMAFWSSFAFARVFGCLDTTFFLFFLTDSVYKDALALVFVIIYSMHVQVVVAFEN
jgi:hypothetical protein